MVFRNKAGPLTSTDVCESSLPVKEHPDKKKNIFEYLKELCDDYGIEPISTHTVSLIRELLKKSLKMN